MAVASSPRAMESLEQTHPIWCSRFGAAERRRMIQEDSTAFSIISVELVSIVCLGLAVIVAAVAISLLGG
ncbi:MAG: hypothetical protein HYX69_08700 [Planctomycetia bacterium]|nr:hypothetical protein [Planctomycetia bacterium]